MFYQSHSKAYSSVFFISISQCECFCWQCGLSILTTDIFVFLSGPGVSLVQVGAGSEDGLALVGKVSDVGELMAVELENGSQGLLLLPLTAKAVGDVVDILVENLNLTLVLEGLVGVGDDLGLVLGDLLGVVLVVVLGLSDSLGKLEDFESEGLDSDDLVGVDVDLLLIALLVCEGRLHVEVLDGVSVVFGNDGTVVGAAFGDVSGDGGLGKDLSGGLNLGLDLGVEGNDGDGKSCETKNKFHL